MKIHVISETPFVMKATGVHTAFVEHIELLKEKNDIEVIVNEDGTGDILHCHTYGLYYFWKGLRYKGRRVFTTHVIPDSIKGSLPFWKIFMPLVKLGLRMVYSYADVCIAISPRVEEAIIESKANTRIINLFNPVNIDTWKRTGEKRRSGRQLLGLKDDEFVVLGVGQLIGRKGIDDFLEIAALLPTLKFVWAGGRPFGGLTEGIARINKKMEKAGSNFIWAGPVELENMPEIYAAADLMLFPSFQENCPLAPIEAAASGIPVVFRDIEEYKSLYYNKYIKAKNIEEFVTLARRMSDDKNFYAEGVQISANLITQFDKDIIRKKMINVYQGLLDEWQISENRVIPQLAE